MTIIFANNAISKLAQPLSSGQTQLTVQTGTGSLFPSPSGGDYFKLTIEDKRTQQIEITHCIGRSGDVLTIVRAQENMTAQNFLVGATVSNRFTRDTPEAILEDVPNPNPLYLGAFASPPSTDNDGDPLTVGMSYFNTGDSRVYYWTGASWVDPIGVASVTSASGVFVLQDPSGDFDGVETQFDLRYTDYSALTQTPDVIIAEQFVVWLDGVSQKPGVDFTIPVLGTIEFAVPPAADVDFHGVWIAVFVSPPGDGTGDVVGPVSSTNDRVALFSGTSGNLLKEATGNGVGILTSGVLSYKTNPAGAFVGTTDVQTLTNKTLTAPAISAPTGIVGTDIGFTPAGTIAATTVEAAIGELDSEFTERSQDLVAAMFTGGSHVNISFSYNDATGVIDATVTGGGSGDVVGPASSVANEIVLFADTTGKLLARASGSGVVIATSGVISYKTNPSGAFVGTSDTQTLTGKTIALGSNTVSGTLAEFNTALTGADFASLAGAETLTNKTITLAGNTVTGTVAEFNAALTGADFYTTGGTDVSVPDGGTGVSSLTAYAVICGGTTSTGAVQSIAGVGSAGQVLTSNGAGALPTFQASGGISDGDKGDITVSSSGAVWEIDAGVVGATELSTNAVTTIKITDANVTLAKLADLAQATVIGRASGAGTGVPTALSATQLTTIVEAATDTVAGKVELATTAEVQTGTDTTRAVTAAGVAAAALLQGKHTEWVDGSALLPRQTDGGALVAINYATNNTVMFGWAADQTTEEGAVFYYKPPKSWDEGTFTYRVFWTATAGSGAVVFAMDAVALSDDDPIDAAWGTAVNVTDTLTATGDLMISAESSAVTAAGTVAVGDLIAFRIRRLPANGSDTLTGDAVVVGVELAFTINAGTDA